MLVLLFSYYLFISDLLFIYLILWFYFLSYVSVRWDRIHSKNSEESVLQEESPDKVEGADGFFGDDEEANDFFGDGGTVEFQVSGTA